MSIRICIDLLSAVEHKRRLFLYNGGPILFWTLLTFNERKKNSLQNTAEEYSRIKKVIQVWNDLRVNYSF